MKIPTITVDKPKRSMFRSEAPYSCTPYGESLPQLQADTCSVAQVGGGHHHDLGRCPEEQVQAGAGTPQHGLPSQNMALITSDYGIMRSISIEWP